AQLGEAVVDTAHGNSSFRNPGSGRREPTAPNLGGGAAVAAPPGGVPSVEPASAGATRLGLAVPHPEPGSALGPGHAAPHAVGFPDAKRVLEALLTHLATVAVDARALLTRVLLISLLEIVRGEEHGGVLAAACGLELPAEHPFVHPARPPRDGLPPS